MGLIAAWQPRATVTHMAALIHDWLLKATVLYSACISHNCMATPVNAIAGYARRHRECFNALSLAAATPWMRHLWHGVTTQTAMSVTSTTYDGLR